MPSIFKLLRRKYDKNDSVRPIEDDDVEVVYDTGNPFAPKLTAVQGDVRSSEAPILTSPSVRSRRNYDSSSTTPTRSNELSSTSPSTPQAKRSWRIKNPFSPATARSNGTAHFSPYLTPKYARTWQARGPSSPSVAAEQDLTHLRSPPATTIGSRVCRAFPLDAPYLKSVEISQDRQWATASPVSNVQSEQCSSLSPLLQKNPVGLTSDDESVPRARENRRRSRSMNDLKHLVRSHSRAQLNLDDDSSLQYVQEQPRQDSRKSSPHRTPPTSRAKDDFVPLVPFQKYYEEDCFSDKKKENWRLDWLEGRRSKIKIPRADYKQQKMANQPPAKSNTSHAKSRTPSIAYTEDVQYGIEFQFNRTLRRRPSGVRNGSGPIEEPPRRIDKVSHSSSCFQSQDVALDPITQQSDFIHSLSRTNRKEKSLQSDSEIKLALKSEQIPRRSRTCTTRSRPVTHSNPPLCISVECPAPKRQATSPSRSVGRISSSTVSETTSMSQPRCPKSSEDHEAQLRYACRSAVPKLRRIPSGFFADRPFAFGKVSPLGSPLRLIKPIPHLERIFGEAGLENNSCVTTAYTDDNDTDWETELSMEEVQQFEQENGLHGGSVGSSLADTSDSEFLARSSETSSGERVGRFNQREYDQDEDPSEASSASSE